ncbi:hypothetical protein KC901_01825 [Patescibacteria group bacterium]|nr:hypothetical protein [Patescibacteria group bacterium]
MKTKLFAMIALVLIAITIGNGLPLLVVIIIALSTTKKEYIEMGIFLISLDVEFDNYKKTFKELWRKIFVRT